MVRVRLLGAEGVEKALHYGAFVGLEQGGEVGPTERRQQLEARIDQGASSRQVDETVRRHAISEESVERRRTEVIERSRQETPNTGSPSST
jgi:hypothetical protein